MIKFILLFLITFNLHAAKSIRSEVNRYRHLKDRQTTEKLLYKEEHSQFFSIDINMSSGLKELLGDISDSTSESSESTQVSGVNAVLSQNVNTERFLTADLELAIPLPYLHFNKLSFLPAIFYEFGVGASISVNNQASAIAPVAQIYFQKYSKMGLHSKIRHNDKKGETFGFSLYQRARADLFVSRNATEVAAGEDLIDLDELEKEEKIYGLDLSFHKKKRGYNYLVELRDIKILDAGGDATNSIGNTPLFHGRYEKIYYIDQYTLEALFGVHYRKKYSLTEGLYVGGRLKIREDSPILFTAKMDSQFMAYSVGLTFKHFNFHYGLKSPFRNPQEDMWVSGIHQIALNVPF